ncbi:uncharacterized protein LOC135390889 isoform X2 [Ornithodoros turicata]|uniref:uncharacterized protein LOC135390889 isoform X2 n=1 Tax=Ornithodoros turicata TaxID=34597 RepID=UPI003138BE13
MKPKVARELQFQKSGLTGLPLAFLSLASEPEIYLKAGGYADQYWSQGDESGVEESSHLATRRTQDIIDKRIQALSPVSSPEGFHTEVDSAKFVLSRPSKVRRNNSSERNQPQHKVNGSFHHHHHRVTTTTTTRKSTTTIEEHSSSKSVQLVRHTPSSREHCLVKTEPLETSIHDKDVEEVDTAPKSRQGGDFPEDVVHALDNLKTEDDTSRRESLLEVGSTGPGYIIVPGGHRRSPSPSRGRLDSIAVPGDRKGTDSSIVDEDGDDVSPKRRSSRGGSDAATSSKKPEQDSRGGPSRAKRRGSTYGALPGASDRLKVRDEKDEAHEDSEMQRRSLSRSRRRSSQVSQIDSASAAFSRLKAQEDNADRSGAAPTSRRSSRAEDRAPSRLKDSDDKGGARLSYQRRKSIATASPTRSEQPQVQEGQRPGSALDKITVHEDMGPVTVTDDKDRDVGDAQVLEASEVASVRKSSVVRESEKDGTETTVSSSEMRRLSSQKDTEQYQERIDESDKRSSREIESQREGSTGDVAGEEEAERQRSGDRKPSAQTPAEQKFEGENAPKQTTPEGLDREPETDTARVETENRLEDFPKADDVARANVDEEEERGERDGVRDEGDSVAVGRKSGEGHERKHRTKEEKAARRSKYEDHSPEGAAKEGNQVESGVPEKDADLASLQDGKQNVPDVTATHGESSSDKGMEECKQSMPDVLKVHGTPEKTSSTEKQTASEATTKHRDESSERIGPRIAKSIKSEKSVKCSDKSSDRRLTEVKDSKPSVTAKGSDQISEKPTKRRLQARPNVATKQRVDLKKEGRQERSAAKSDLPSKQSNVTSRRATRNTKEGQEVKGSLTIKKTAITNEEKNKRDKSTVSSKPSRSSRVVIEKARVRLVPGRPPGQEAKASKETEDIKKYIRGEHVSNTKSEQQVVDQEKEEGKRKKKVQKGVNKVFRQEGKKELDVVTEVAKEVVKDVVEKSVERITGHKTDKTKLTSPKFAIEVSVVELGQSATQTESGNVPGNKDDDFAPRKGGGEDRGEKEGGDGEDEEGEGKEERKEAVEREERRGKERSVRAKKRALEHGEDDVETSVIVAETAAFVEAGKHVVGGETGEVEVGSDGEMSGERVDVEGREESDDEEGLEDDTLYREHGVTDEQGRASAGEHEEEGEEGAPLQVLYEATTAEEEEEDDESGEKRKVPADETEGVSESHVSADLLEGNDASEMVRNEDEDGRESTGKIQPDEHDDEERNDSIEKETEESEEQDGGDPATFDASDDTARPDGEQDNGTEDEREIETGLKQTADDSERETHADVELQATQSDGQFKQLVDGEEIFAESTTFTTHSNGENFVQGEERAEELDEASHITTHSETKETSVREPRHVGGISDSAEKTDEAAANAASLPDEGHGSVGDHLVIRKIDEAGERQDHENGKSSDKADVSDAGGDEDEVSTGVVNAKCEENETTGSNLEEDGGDPSARKRQDGELSPTRDGAQSATEEASLLEDNELRNDANVCRGNDPSERRDENSAGPEDGGSHSVEADDSASSGSSKSSAKSSSESERLMKIGREEVDVFEGGITEAVELSSANETRREMEKTHDADAKEGVADDHEAGGEKVERKLREEDEQGPVEVPSEVETGHERDEAASRSNQNSKDSEASNFNGDDVDAPAQVSSIAGDALKHYDMEHSADVDEAEDILDSGITESILEVLSRANSAMEDTRANDTSEETAEADGDNYVTEHEMKASNDGEDNEGLITTQGNEARHKDDNVAEGAKASDAQGAKEQEAADVSTRDLEDLNGSQGTAVSIDTGQGLESALEDHEGCRLAKTDVKPNELDVSGVASEVLDDIPEHQDNGVVNQECSESGELKEPIDESDETISETVESDTVEIAHSTITTIREEVEIVEKAVDRTNSAGGSPTELDTPENTDQGSILEDNTAVDAEGSTEDSNNEVNIGIQPIVDSSSMTRDLAGHDEGDRNDILGENVETSSVTGAVLASAHRISEDSHEIEGDSVEISPVPEEATNQKMQPENRTDTEEQTNDIGVVVSKDNDTSEEVASIEKTSTVRRDTDNDLLNESQQRISPEPDGIKDAGSATAERSPDLHHSASHARIDEERPKEFSQLVQNEVVTAEVRELTYNESVMSATEINEQTVVSSSANVHFHGERDLSSRVSKASSGRRRRSSKSAVSGHVKATKKSALKKHQTSHALLQSEGADLDSGLDDISTTFRNDDEVSDVRYTDENSRKDVHSKVSSISGELTEEHLVEDIRTQDRINVETRTTEHVELSASNVTSVTTPPETAAATQDLDFNLQELSKYEDDSACVDIMHPGSRASDHSLDLSLGHSTHGGQSPVDGKELPDEGISVDGSATRDLNEYDDDDLTHASTDLDTAPSSSGRGSETSGTPLLPPLHQPTIKTPSVPRVFKIKGPSAVNALPSKFRKETRLYESVHRKRIITNETFSVSETPIRRVRSDEAGLDRSRRSRTEETSSRVTVTGRSERRRLLGRNTRSVNMEEQGLLEFEKLTRNLNALRSERRACEAKREDLLRRARFLQHKTTSTRDQARDVWRRRYLEEKKATPRLEEECARWRLELERLHRELLARVEGELRFAGHRLEQPSDRLSYKIMIAKILQEIEDLKRRLEYTRIALGAEVRLRSHAEREVKTLREDLLKKKIQVTLTRKETQTVMAPFLRDSFYFVGAV